MMQLFRRPSSVACATALCLSHVGRLTLPSPVLSLQNIVARSCSRSVWLAGAQVQGGWWPGFVRGSLSKFHCDRFPCSTGFDHMRLNIDFRRRILLQSCRTLVPNKINGYSKIESN